MKRVIRGLLAALFLFGTACGALAQQHDPGLTVLGRGEVSATPDRAVLRLGAVSQAETAGDAQGRVDAAVRGIVQGIKRLGIPEEKIATTQLTLSPVYRDRSKGPSQEPQEPVIVGYRAGNIVRVTVDDLKILGKVVDAGLLAGANRVDGISFDLRDDSRQRRQALGLAARDAQTKAEGIAAALGVPLGRVRSVAEGGVSLVRPRMDAVSVYAAREAVAIQPGQLQVEASLTVSYAIGERPLSPGGPHPPTCPCR
ncbi:MAG: SIMPL domain-containing protein [Syntrophales bacterium]